METNYQFTDSEGYYKLLYWPLDDNPLKEHSTRDANDFDRLFLSYFNEYKKISSMADGLPKFKEYLKLYSDISQRADPTGYNHYAYIYADNLKEPEYDELRKENPPYSSLDKSCIPNDIIQLTKVKMLVLFMELQHNIIWFGKYKLQRKHNNNSINNDDDLPIIHHFNIKNSKDELLYMLKCLKNVEWKHNRLKEVGLVSNSITDDEWIYALKGGKILNKRKLPWKAKYACKAFVQQFLNSDYDIAEKVFCADNGTDFKDLKYCNSSKNKEVCNVKNGKIAQIIKECTLKYK